ncbi:SPOR domain-containing protein, partial [Mycobacterium tuberculosis]|nr:SPOR domain-containing protein [Mycobacterium tuberculosis]
FVVSLGLFRDKERAQQRLDELRAKDVRTAVVTQTRRLGSQTSLRVTASADAASGVAAQLAALKKTLGAEDLHACAAVTASRYRLRTLRARACAAPWSIGRARTESPAPCHPS